MLSFLRRRLSAGGVALIYAGFASLWIVISDRLLGVVSDEPSLLVGFSVFKGMAFVLVTSSLLYLLLRGWVEYRLAENQPRTITPQPRTSTLILTFVGLAALPAMLGFSIVQLHGPEMKDKTFGNLRAIAELKATQISQWLNERQADSNALTTDPSFAEPVQQLLQHYDNNLRQLILGRMERLRIAHGYTGMALLNTQGEPLLQLGDFSDVPDHIRALATRAMSSGEIQRSRLSRDQNGELHLDWVVPVLLEESGGVRPIAVVAFHINPESFLLPLIQHWPIPSASGEILVVYRHGDDAAFFSSAYARAHQGHGLISQQALQDSEQPSAIALRNGGAGITAGVDYRGARILAAYQPIASTDWYLVTKIDRAEALAPMYWLVFWVSIVGLFTVAAVATAVLLLWRQQQRAHRFELLAQAAEQDRLLRKFYDLPFIGMAFIGIAPNQRNWIQCNDRLCHMLGYAHQELINLSWLQLIHPEDRDAALANVKQMLRGKTEGYSMEQRFIRADGRVIFTVVDTKCLRRADGKVEMCISTIDDITESRRAREEIRTLNRLYRVHSSINQVIVRRRQPLDLLREACEIAVREGGFHIAWAAMLDADGTTVRPVAHAGAIGDYLEQIQISVSGRHSQGPTGSALRTGQTVACNDIVSDPKMAPWQERARNIGCRASIALPLRVAGKVRGTLNLGATQAGIFDAAEINLLEELSNDISYALEIAEADQEHERIQEALNESQEQFRRAVEEAPFPMMIHAEDGEVLTVNRAWIEISGYARADIPTIRDWVESAFREQRELAYDKIAQIFTLAEREVLRGNALVRCADHAQRDWEFSGVRLGNLPDGRRLAISMVTDVTERNWAMSALRQSEQQYRLLFAANPHPMWVFSLDTLRFLEVNEAAIQHYGYSRAEFLSMTIADIRPKEDLPRFLDGLQQHQASKIWRAELWKHRKRDGSLIDVEVIANLMEFAGEKARVVLIHDVTERLRAEEQLRQAAIVFDSTNEGIVITDAEQRILRVNRAFCNLTGYSADEVLGKTPRLLRSGVQEPTFYAAMWQSLLQTGVWQGEIWNQRKNGELYPELLNISAVYDQQGALTNYVGVFADLSQVKESEERIDFIAHHDLLTGLPNRLLLAARLQHSIDIARRDGSTLALLVVDLDRFKAVNDSYGHGAGDILLQRVAERLTSRLRGTDTVTRIGGDEFAILIENLAQAQDAARVALDILDLLNESWRLGEHAEVRLSACLGISLFPEHGQNPEELLQQADSALHQAKTEGKGRFQFFSAELTQTARERSDLEARLRRGIADGQLRAYYQPQVDIASGRIIGAEALVRWQDPEHGLIPPGRFIPLAEETGLISEIGAWVLRETCRQGRAWMDQGLPPLSLAVNLSAHQLRHDDIVTLVLQTLEETGFPAQRLELELTETALMQRAVEVVAVLEQLRALGVTLAMDDFGTGYSSLAYLKRFPLDVLKVDKSFVDDLPQQQDAMEIVATIIAMGHTLGMDVVAEGVETAEQLAFLRSKGCNHYQGYLLSPPIPAEAFAALLQQHQPDGI